MLIFPAIDLKGGRCVRLYQGRMEDATVYNDDPVSQALAWQAKGAQMIHLVDLDGAFEGEPKNLPVIQSILEAVTVAVQLGGGIRDLNIIDRYLRLGVSRVILGTAAIKNPDLLSAACKEYGQRIVLGLDARDGKVATDGWAGTSQVTALELAREMKERGLRRVVYTDISKDGTLAGPNLAATAELARATGLKVIASGGFATMDDVKAAAALEGDGIEGAILGKSIYTGSIDVAEAIAVAREGRAC
ncbi:1-(5-phosphoribosyl)-5-[(5-phosphoribosylamino)methylideneamino]imidazole-4-carboxamide isomerase [Heliobacterium gestii]|uniref:1-(5-phosphoribosyl)-5-[(5-phosphoribosylamino)methylideneamino] imidazole-4-carboxamide isomerase n=1 Tax=Heliomicrobium gestii TaxID=2699 RepID=A0A845LHZ8_HELGE|nr:1-(5-phosphoribosyl)-5-[(5-phosphoribosylamino)methylideneamino]imidazole-4-carboxamide isomerase [Heliomicrobium gestii]MBM7867651.1 phosphoribosylformimino-5-aminoimidazole carboxamide ribotide isomerase [Heliomicrobium gestii]MZP44045.1 1-(5-phosphoribosyl)-5-[(5-phosphoribosylamino)methylideneamino]imidazole-4-carboxamide isomerase [Heliomicrobium gestii]